MDYEQPIHYDMNTPAVLVTHTQHSIPHTPDEMLERIVLATHVDTRSNITNNKMQKRKGPSSEYKNPFRQRAIINNKPYFRLSSTRQNRMT